MDPINKELLEIGNDHVAEVIDAMYDDYIDEFTAEEEVLRYAAFSYDNDAQAYGEY